VYARADVDEAETLNCSNCQTTFSDVDQLVEHSTQPCLTVEQCSDEAANVDDDREVRAAAPAAESDGDVESTPVKSDNMEDVDAEFDATAADEFTQPRVSPSSVRPFPSFEADSDHDDGHVSDDYVLRNVSSSQFVDRALGPEADAPSCSGAASRQQFAVVEGSDEGRSPKTTKAQLIDNNMSPASKIAMLESVVYALHQQQMFQLELIEALRRQLAAALAASSTSHPGDDATLDLTLPRSSTSETTALNPGSSLSSLMRLSTSVDSRRAPPPPPPGVHSPPSTSPTALSDSQEMVMATSWPTDQTLIKSSLSSSSACLPSSLLSTPKHGPPQLSDLSLFKKGQSVLSA